VIQSYDPSTGGFQWSRSLDWLIYSSPILANGVVYANTLSSLYTLNAGNGAILWRGSAPTDTGAAPVGVDAILYSLYGVLGWKTLCIQRQWRSPVVGSGRPTRH
jgi:outer membrane protein assembly factor BamB